MKTRQDNGPSAVVIGASVGAIEALMALLPALPADYPAAVLVVVHVPPESGSLLADLFIPRCAIRVKEAEDKEPIRESTVYFAAANYHLLVEPDFSLSLSNDEPVRYSRPSLDVLFETAADAYGDSLTGVILTGANNDGARGLRAVCDAGGAAFVQAPGTAECSVMPQSALDLCPEAVPMPLQQISVALNQLSSIR